MKTLIINNHTKHIAELEALFPSSTVVNKEGLSETIDLDSFDLLVISGGSGIPTVRHHKDYYALEEKLIRESTIPILGICLGSEIIVDVFGGELTEISTLHRGDMILAVTDQSLKGSLGTDILTVYEAHCVSIKRLPTDFIDCAHSDHGIELFKHISRPIIGIQFHPEVGKHGDLWRWVFQTLSIQ